MARNIRVNQSHFAMIPQANIRRSVFDRSHVYKTTFNEGQLIPYFVDEVIPGDTFTLNPVEFCRLATPVVPFMDNIYIESFFFFVPSRLVYDKWVNLCGEQENPEDSTDYLVPTVSLTGDMTNKLPDYMGIACASGTFNNVSVNCLPFRSYWLIWNEWFRDENLQKSVKVSKGETNTVLEPMGQSTANPNYGLPSGVKKWYDPAPRGKRFDYFTGSLPWPSKGPAVDLPLGGNAPIIASSDVSVPAGSKLNSIFPNTRDSLFLCSDTSYVLPNSVTASFSNAGESYILGSNVPPRVAVSPFYADMSNVTLATINSLRQAFMLQRYYEIDARGGTRYTEKLQAHFGVTNPDARLQRPEFLGSHSSMMTINPVTQTSSTDSTTPQGNLAAYGLNAQRYHAFTKSFSEFGYVIGLINVRADLTYQQGVNRMWLRSDVLDFYWPSFAHLGEQAIENIEIYCQGNDDDKKVFGYQERYAEYRYKPSLITGQFRSTYKEPLDIWHLSQKFATLPTLSDEFIQDHPPISRVVAVPSYPHFLLDVKFNLKCIRPMPMYGIPGMMGHF
nr:MAG: major capsid protein [Microviridae sp.]